MRQRSLPLILASELADKLASAVFVVDAEGTLVYYNEYAGELLGRPYADAGPMKLEEWAGAFAPAHPEAGNHLDPEELPLVVAVRQRRPAHLPMRITAADGEERQLAVTALPLFAQKDRFVGAVAMFWDAG